MIQLVQRLYDPDSGSLLLDQTDIREINIGWLRDQIGVVGQVSSYWSITIILSSDWPGAGPVRDHHQG